MSGRVPVAVRWLISAVALLVPTHRRAAWQRQWEAELEHRSVERVRESGRLQPGSRERGLLNFALGSVAHAIYLRREEAGMRGYLADLRQSARALCRRPGFTALVVATLAIGIGTATAIFSLAESILLRPLPLEDSDRLVRIYSTNVSRGMEQFSVSYPDYVDFAARDDLFESASFYIGGESDIAGEGDPERIRVASVHTSFFETLGSPTVIGRTLAPDDHDPRSEATAVLAESFWTRRFGADPALVGRTIRIDGVPHTVVGVVRDGFAWPVGTQVWTPLQWGGVAPAFADARTNHTWQVLARLMPGVSVNTASEQVRAVARATYSGEGIALGELGTEAGAIPLHASAAGSQTGAILGVMAAAVFLVLLIACMNVSGLLLTRAWGRARELSLRSALGARRSRLVGILLGESVLLALLGGVLGVGLAYVGLTRAMALVPPDVTNLNEVELNATVLSVAIAISVIAALLAGLLPALRASRTSAADAMREGGTQTSQSRGGRRLRQGLVVGELALSLALLVAAGVTIRGFQRQIETDPGFEVSKLLSFTVRLPESRYGEAALVDAYYAEAIDRLERHPGIAAAASTSRLPLGAGGFGLFRSFVFDDAPSPPEGAEFRAGWVEVDSGYFETLGVTPLEGRPFSVDDGADAPLVAIVNQRLARQMAPDGSIVGKQIRSYYDENLPRTVVGVIGDLQFNELSRDQREALVLVPRAQAVRRSMAFLVRTEGDPAQMIPVVRQAMAELDPDVALDGLQTLRDAHAAGLTGVRFLTVLFGTFGGLALILAVSGVYGLVSYSVSQRTQEIGIRMAMGASALSVRRAVIAEATLLAGLGVIIGTAIAYGFSRLLTAALFGVPQLELTTFLFVALLLSSSVVLASWFPANRATRVDPVVALRSE